MRRAALVVAAAVFLLGAPSAHAQGSAPCVDAAAEDACPDPYAAAHALWDAGYEDEARSEARRVATEDAPGTAIPERFRAPQASRGDETIAWLEDRTDDAGTVSGAVAVLVVLVALAALGMLWVLRRILRPRVVVADPAGEVPGGAALSTLLMQELQSSGTGVSVERVDGAASTPALDVASVFDGPWSWVPALLRRTSKRATITVSLRPATVDEERVAVGVAIAASGNRVLTSRVFVESGEERPVAELAAMMVPRIAAWVIGDLVARREVVDPGATSATPPDVRWESWGWFRRGVAAAHRGRRDEARSCYLHAVETDATNAEAWVNLAALDLREPAHLARVAARLEAAHDLGRERPGHESLAMRVLYLRAVTDLHAAGDDPPPGHRKLTDAAQHATVLVATVARTLLAPSERRSAATRDARRVADASLDAALTLLRSIQIARRVADPEAGREPADRDRALRRLATLDAPAAPEVGPEALRRLLEAVRPRHAWARAACYNLACNEARRLASADAADRPALAEEMLEQLLRGLEGADRSLVRWARDRDPAFAGLRSDEGELGERFRSVLTDLLPGPPQRAAGQWTVAVHV